jgi:hypothetical protein
MAAPCSFCGSTVGPFDQVEGLFTVLMCTDCQAARGDGKGPYRVMTRAEIRAGLDLLPTWALEQKAAANRQVIATMRERLAAGEAVLACTRNRTWPGCNGKLRSPRSWSHSAGEWKRAAKGHDLGGPLRCAAPLSL